MLEELFDLNTKIDHRQPIWHKGNLPNQITFEMLDNNESKQINWELLVYDESNHITFKIIHYFDYFSGSSDYFKSNQVLKIRKNNPNTFKVTQHFPSIPIFQKEIRVFVKGLWS